MHMKRTADRLFGDAYLWSVLGAGRNQMFIAAMSAVMGGNVRVGLEDSLWLGRGELGGADAAQRTGEGRVGEEGRSRWAADHLKKKKTKQSSLDCSDNINRRAARHNAEAYT